MADEEKQEEEKIELTSRPSGQDRIYIEQVDEQIQLGTIEPTDWEEDFIDSLRMCIEEDRPWTTKQAAKFDELLTKWIPLLSA